MGWSGPMTHRQFRAWVEFLREDWNNPSRSDYYQMQVALEVVRSRAGTKSRRLKLNDLKIPFEERSVKKVPTSGPRVVTKEDILRINKLAALRKAGGGIPRRPLPNPPTPSPRKD